MDTDQHLRIARETIAKVRFCFAVTLAKDGSVNARVVEPFPLSDDWRVRFLTLRTSRKVKEAERAGKLTLAYQYDAEAAYVTLVGRPRIIDDVEVKRSLWSENTYRWYPGGPEDPNVVLVELETERIELWNLKREVMPGISAAVLERDGASWRYSTS